MAARAEPDIQLIAMLASAIGEAVTPARLLGRGASGEAWLLRTRHGSYVLRVLNGRPNRTDLPTEIEIRRWSRGRTVGRHERPRAPAPARDRRSPLFPRRRSPSRVALQAPRPRAPPCPCPGPSAQDREGPRARQRVRRESGAGVSGARGRAARPPRARGRGRRLALNPAASLGDSRPEWGRRAHPGAAATRARAAGG